MFAERCKCIIWLCSSVAFASLVLLFCMICAFVLHFQIAFWKTLDSCNHKFIAKKLHIENAFPGHVHFPIAMFSQIYRKFNYFRVLVHHQGSPPLSLYRPASSQSRREIHVLTTPTESLNTAMISKRPGATRLWLGGLRYGTDLGSMQQALLL